MLNQRKLNTIVKRWLLEMIRTAIFDLNGTLASGHYPSYKEILEDEIGLIGRKDGGITHDWLRALSRGESTLRETLTHFYHIQDYEDIKSKLYHSLMRGVKLREGAVHLLQQLEKQYKLVLCSDTTGVAKAVVRKLNLENYFKKEFYSNDLKCLKSEKRFWVKILNHLGNPTTSELIMIGDNPSADIYWPNILGMYTIRIPSSMSSSEKFWTLYLNQINQDAVKPTFSVDHLEAMLDIIKQIK